MWKGIGDVIIGRLQIGKGSGRKLDADADADVPLELEEVWLCP